ncbi:MAG: hypothetical protein NZ570_05670 [Candidatus Caldarchaeum sp.]|nr:hypothetical protein [Candidatus Caldarchaeum sp.]
MIIQVLKNWRWLSRTQWLSREELMSIQAQKLRAMVSHAYNTTAFYKRLYGPTLPEIQTSRDIKKLPLITKEHLRSVPLEERTAVGTDLKRCLKRTTSGTSGIPVVILEDPASAAYVEGLSIRRLWAYGVRPWHKVVRVVSGSPEKVYTENIADLAGLWGSFRRNRVTRLSLAEDPRNHLEIFKKGVDVLFAFVTYYRALREVCEEREVDINFKIAITAGELLDSATRKMISDTFGAEVFDGYGCVEVAAPSHLAWECPSHYAYHINVDSVVLEFLKDGEEVSPGESGEVVATSLFRWATPVIRYRLGDLATPLDDECPCGRGLPLLKNIEGRVVDMIRIPDGGFISPYAVMETIQDVEGLGQYKVLQRSDYSIEVMVKAVGDVEKVVAEVDRRCRMLFKTLDYRIKVVDKIEAERGKKFKFVESQVTS